MFHQIRTRKVASFSGQDSASELPFSNNTTDIGLTFAEAHTVNILFASSYANSASSPTFVRALIGLPRCIEVSIADR